MRVHVNDSQQDVLPVHLSPPLPQFSSDGNKLGIALGKELGAELGRMLGFALG